MADFSYLCSPQGAVFVLPVPAPHKGSGGECGETWPHRAVPMSPGTPASTLEWFVMSRNGLAHFSFNAFLLIEQIFALEALGVSDPPPYPSQLASLPLPSPLPQRKEPSPFRGVCASRLYPYGTCFEEKCFRCGCVLL